MKRSTGLSGRFQAAGLLSAVTCILLTASPASAATIDYTDAASFLAALQSSSTDNFDYPSLLPSTDQAYGSAVNFASYLVATNPADNIWISSINDPANPANQTLSTISSDVNLDFTFDPGINAVGGNFFPTDINGNVTAGPITVTLGDGTSKILTTDPAALLPFIGFISNVDIVSLSISTGGSGNYAAVDNLIVGTAIPAAPTATPEPQSIFLLLGGLSAGAWRLSRRKTSSLRTE
jgi:hypothetical protein